MYVITWNITVFASYLMMRFGRDSCFFHEKGLALNSESTRNIQNYSTHIYKLFITNTGGYKKRPL